MLCDIRVKLKWPLLEVAAAAAVEATAVVVKHLRLPFVSLLPLPLLELAKPEELEVITLGAHTVVTDGCLLSDI